MGNFKRICSSTSKLRLLLASATGFLFCVEVILMHWIRSLHSAYAKIKLLGVKNDEKNVEANLLVQMVRYKNIFYNYCFIHRDGSIPLQTLWRKFQEYSLEFMQIFCDAVIIFVFSHSQPPKQCCRTVMIFLRFRFRRWKSFGSGSGSRPYLAQFSNNKKFVQNLAFSMSDAALFPKS
jgi:hypothetical protein